MPCNDWLTKGARSSLAQYLDVLDLETREHSGGVVNLARLLGNHYQLSVEEQNLLIMAARYHDLGKADPEISEIIKQPRTPTKEEWDVIRRHARLSGSILDSFRVDGQVIHLVVAHHEPVIYGGCHLKVLVLLMLADIIQATTSNRPYRSGPLGKDKILEELAQRLGDLLAIVGGTTIFEILLALLAKSKMDDSSSILGSLNL